MSASESNTTVSFNFERKEGKSDLYSITTDFETDADFISEIDPTVDLANGKDYQVTAIDAKNFLLKINN